MTGEVELVGDDDGIVVVGDRRDIDRFLRSAGLTHSAQGFDLRAVSSYLRVGAESAQAASEIAEKSARYLKLTSESAQAVKDAGGLMTSTRAGISYALLGAPGRVDGWLQVEGGAGALLTNPAVLGGLGGFLTRAAHEIEAKELRALLVQIDGKLDDLRRRQRDEVLARVSSAAAAIDEARVLRESGGDPQTLWDKVSGASTMVTTLQEDALQALGAAADKATQASKMREVKTAAAELEEEVALQLAIIGRCFELQDEFEVIELDHVLATAPEHFEGHSLGKAKVRSTRRAEVVAKTERLLQQMDEVGGVAVANIVLHRKAAQTVVGSLERSVAALDDFSEPLGVAAARHGWRVPTWREAVRDPQSLRRAGAEIGQKAAVGVGVVALGGVAVLVGSPAEKDSTSD